MASAVTKQVVSELSRRRLGDGGGVYREGDPNLKDLGFRRRKSKIFIRSRVWGIKISPLSIFDLVYEYLHLGCCPLRRWPETRQVAVDRVRV